MFIIDLQTHPSLHATHGNRLPNARKCEKCTTTLLPDTAPFKSSHRHTHNFHLALRSQCCKKLQIITVNRGQQFRQRGWLRGWEGVERLEVCYEGAEEEGGGLWTKTWTIGGGGQGGNGWFRQGITRLTRMAKYKQQKKPNFPVSLSSQGGHSE